MCCQTLSDIDKSLTTIDNSIDATFVWPLKNVASYVPSLPSLMPIRPVSRPPSSQPLICPFAVAPYDDDDCNEYGGGDNNGDDDGYDLYDDREQHGKPVLPLHQTC